MRLSNAPGFGDEPFAQIGAAAVKVKLLPLLCIEVEVDEVTLNGLRLSLRRDANGHTNWEDLAGKKAEEKPDTGAAGPVLASFALGGINLRDAVIVWDDRAAATRYEISKLNLHTGPVTLDQPVRIDSDFDLASIQPALGAHVQLATQALYHFDSKRLELNGIELAAHVRNAALQDAEIKLAATALLDLTAQHYQMRGLNVSADLKGDKLPGKHISAALATDLDVDLKDNRLPPAPMTPRSPSSRANSISPRCAAMPRSPTSPNPRCVFISRSTISTPTAICHRPHRKVPWHRPLPPHRPSRRPAPRARRSTRCARSTSTAPSPSASSRSRN